MADPVATNNRLSSTPTSLSPHLSNRPPPSKALHAQTVTHNTAGYFVSTSLFFVFICMSLNILKFTSSFTVATCVLRHSASVCSVLVCSFFSFPSTQSTSLLYEPTHAKLNSSKKEKEARNKTVGSISAASLPLLVAVFLSGSQPHIDRLVFFFFLVCARADRVLDLQSPIPCSPRPGCTGYPLLSPSTRIHRHPIHISSPSLPTYPFTKPFAHLSVSVSLTSFYFVLCLFPLPFLLLQQIHAFDTRLLRGCSSKTPPHSSPTPSKKKKNLRRRSSLRLIRSHYSLTLRVGVCVHVVRLSFRL
ncbi:hypothetical protein LDBPK_291430 [Leishmania donovani]|uniref:Uncharacterized protein n=1 Tax=Leishmania donovani TaxID=5661 RepID=E9BKT9_LEIDO|nr:hypothetical protein LDBPK_291430 [Leishmania donovani]CBZ35867.1 hypothetical protein LDBPK_291430 [Leishmania donovani]